MKMVLYKSAKPYTRWWWFAGEIKKDDIAFQLDWVKENNFGGVEIAWLYPLKKSPHTPKWLSSEWDKVVAFAKKYATSIGLGCDFTFGSLWPFGGTIVPKKDASRNFYGISCQKIDRAWEMHFNKQGYVLNHLNRFALVRYSKKMGKALAPALKIAPAALFCDSWEVDTEKLWTLDLDKSFLEKYGYSVNKYMQEIDRYPDVRYDYRKLIAEYILDEFYKPYTEICHKLGAFSRVQCHGSPTDLLASYSYADIPESEAILFDPEFSVITASAALLSGRNIVSTEAFTCIYGWIPYPGPGQFQKKEQTADMKLMADALFANGVNQVIWHGMPYNPQNSDNRFYASVHVGPDSSFADEITAFNKYMQKVSSIMRLGRVYSDVAVYLPIEDTWMANTLPRKLQKPSAKYHWEMHYTRTPPELKGHHPLWISSYFLKNAKYKKGLLRCGKAEFTSLYINSKWLDMDGLKHILRLAKEGLPVCLTQIPRQPGRIKSPDYKTMLKELVSLKNVSSSFNKIAVRAALVIGKNLPDFWCREKGNGKYIFFAHPKAQNLTYPLKYGYSFTKGVIRKSIRIWVKGVYKKITLVFKPYQSIILKIDASGRIKPIKVDFIPKTPVVS
ncbi:MAG: hypothetical protein HY811_04100 [Planctomycetes bacterium]|nr:hypothetical protein [Planctomycetota bacterium]